MEQNVNKKILLHACCAICSGYPITLLKELGYTPVVYFCNPNLNTKEEFDRRAEAQKQICKEFNVELIIEEYDHKIFLLTSKGLETEPEKGKRCDKCIELRLKMTAQKAKELEINEFTTSLTVSPHKNFLKIHSLGENIAKEYNLSYPPMDFKKKDGFLKTNKISKELNLYRQNYCGCEFSVRK